MNKEKKIIEVLSLKVLLISALLVIALFVFAFLAEGVIKDHQRAMDKNIILFFNNYSSPVLIKIMELFSFLGSVYFLIPAYLIIITWLFIKKQFRSGIDMAIIALGSTLMVFCLKKLFHRQRPDLPIVHGIHTYSFPSGHALSSFVFCSILIFIVRRNTAKKLYRRIATISLIFLSIMISTSRIFLRMHYPTDVIASFCLGIVWVIVSLWILKKINREYLVKNNLTPVKTNKL